LLGYQSYAFAEGPSIWPAVLMGIAGSVLVGAVLTYLLAWLADRADWKSVTASIKNRDHSAV